MPFVRGTSGNPRGRPRGITDRRTKLRQQIEAHADELVELALEQARAGDVATLRLLLERCLPPIRPVSALVPDAVVLDAISERLVEVIA